MPDQDYYSQEVQNAPAVQKQPSQVSQGSQNTDFYSQEVVQGGNDNQSQIDKQVDQSLNMPNGNVNAPEQNSPLSFMDNLNMASLNDPEAQQNFLKSRFKFAEPITDYTGKPTGQFNVGNDPNNLQSIHPGNMGDKAISTLATLSSIIPSVVGQVGGALGGAALGTMAEGGIPGPVTIVGGILGAGAGAGAGEFAKNKMMESVKGYNPQKAAVDNIIIAGFGMGGQALGEAISIGAKNYIAPKVGSAIDGMLTKNPGGAIALAKIFKFIANINPKDTLAACKIGWGNLSKNPQAWDADEIDNIAQDVSKSFNQKKGIATSALDAAENSLLRDNPHAQVATKDILEQMTDQFGDNGLKILNKTESSLDGMGSTFQFRDDIPSDVKLKDVKTFMTRLGAQTTDGSKTFHIPDDATTTLSEAISAKRLFQRTFNNPNFNESVSNVVKQGLYGEGPSPLYPKGISGLRSAINDTAQATGHDSYIIANKNFSNLMDASQGKISGEGGKFTVPEWMDLKDPSSVAKYLKKSNELNSFGQKALSNLHNEIGGDFVDRAKQWATAQGIQRATPQVLKLSIVASLASMAIPGGNLMDKAERVPLAFALSSPSGVKMMGRSSEVASSLGNRLLNYMAKSASSNTGKQVISNTASQSGKSVISGLLSNSKQ